MLGHPMLESAQVNFSKNLACPRGDLFDKPISAEM